MSYRIISTPESRAAEAAAKAAAEAAARSTAQETAAPLSNATTVPESTPQVDTSTLPASIQQNEREEFMARIEGSYSPTTESEKFVAHEIANVMWRIKWLEVMEQDAMSGTENPFLDDVEIVAENLERIEKLRQNLERSYARWTREWRALQQEIRRERQQQMKAQQLQQKVRQQAMDRRMHDYIFGPLPGEPGHQRTASPSQPTKTAKDGSPPLNSALPRLSPSASNIAPPSPAHRL